MIWENGIEHILSYTETIASPGSCRLMFLNESPWDDLSEGWKMGRGEEVGSGWEHVYPVGSMMYGKPI